VYYNPQTKFPDSNEVRRVVRGSVSIQSNFFAIWWLVRQQRIKFTCVVFTILIYALMCAFTMCVFYQSINILCKAQIQIIH
jgi:hypothetical protein